MGGDKNKESLQTHERFSNKRNGFRAKIYKK